MHLHVLSLAFIIFFPHLYFSFKNERETHDQFPVLSVMFVILQAFVILSVFGFWDFGGLFDFDFFPSLNFSQ